MELLSDLHYNPEFIRTIPLGAVGESMRFMIETECEFSRREWVSSWHSVMLCAVVAVILEYFQWEHAWRCLVAAAELHACTELPLDVHEDAHCHHGQCCAAGCFTVELLRLSHNNQANRWLTHLLYRQWSLRGLTKCVYITLTSFHFSSVLVSTNLHGDHLWVSSFYQFNVGCCFKILG